MSLDSEQLLNEEVIEQPVLYWYNVHCRSEREHDKLQHEVCQC